MRENMGLYRGKRKDNGEWVYGYYFERKDTQGNIIESIIIVDAYEQITGGQRYVRSNLNYECFRVDPETVGMCSGVPDKHGNLIYEDDFVRINEDVKETFVRVEDGPVRFSRGGFFVNNYGDILSSFDVIADFRGVLRGEVIGNIRDNPELLLEVCK